MSTATEVAAGGTSRAAAVEEYILHHVSNAQEWHLPFLPPIHLPSFMSLHAVMLVIAALILVTLFVFIYRKDDRAPSGMTNLLESLVLFIRNDICIANLGEEDGKKLTPLFCSFFFFITTLNLMGLVPLFATATGNVNVTGGLASITLLFMTVVAIFKNGPVGFFKAFVPHGIPWPVLILIVPLEMVGVLIKCFALMIRLFANMLAGHIVIFSLLGLVVSFGAFALPAVVLALGINLMEIFISLLQAYIFTLLSAMFIGQIFHPAH